MNRRSEGESVREKKKKGKKRGRESETETETEASEEAAAACWLVATGPPQSSARELLSCSEEVSKGCLSFISLLLSSPPWFFFFFVLLLQRLPAPQLSLSLLLKDSSVFSAGLQGTRFSFLFFFFFS